MKREAPMEAPKLTLPTVHLNGTSAKDLREQYLAAHRAVEDAIRKIQETHPNGRDYYPQEPGAIDSAIAEHWSRMERLRVVSNELMALCSHADSFCKD